MMTINISRIVISCFVGVGAPLSRVFPNLSKNQMEAGYSLAAKTLNRFWDNRPHPCTAIRLLVFVIIPFCIVFQGPERVAQLWGDPFGVLCTTSTLFYKRATPSGSEYEVFCKLEEDLPRRLTKNGGFVSRKKTCRVVIC